MRLVTFLSALVVVASVACGGDEKPAPTAEPPSVRGSWVITPQVPGQPFQALAAFGAGGVFVTTGSDQDGTGIGQWAALGADGFTFSYLNYHFGADGKLTTVTIVKAKGTFKNDSMTGTASQSVAGPTGSVLQPAQSVSFTGKRMTAE